jgi:hypothetical protein
MSKRFCILITIWIQKFLHECIPTFGLNINECSSGLAAAVTPTDRKA